MAYSIEIDTLITHDANGLNFYKYGKVLADRECKTCFFLSSI